MRIFPAAWLAVAVCLPALAAAETAGHVYFSKGAVFVVSAQGVRQPLRKDMVVEAKQTLVTEGDGLLQIKFTDGAFLALPASTQLRIDEYKTRTGTESAFLTLLRGGLRTITGLIGKANPAAYRVSTPTATIGIRGTHYLARVCNGDCFTANQKPEPDGLFASVVEGQINLTNDAGKLDLSAGRSAYVASRTSPPIFADHMPMVSAGSPATAHQDGDGGAADNVEAGIEDMEATLRNLAGLAPGIENLSGLREEGDAFLAPVNGSYQAGQEVFKVDGRPVIANLVGIEGGGASDVSRISPVGSLIETEFNVSAYVDANQALRVITNISGSASNGTASINDVFADSDLFMVRWGGPGQLGGTLNMELRGNQSVHWLITRPYESPLPTTGTATYDMFAATRPTSSDPAQPLGTLTAASVGINFAGSSACGGLPCANYNLVADTFRATGFAGIDAIGDFETGNGGTQPGTVTGSVCSGPGCSAFVHGAFGGSGVARGGITVPSKLGLVYEISDPAGNRAFHGAVGLGPR
jgi:hypothetical protein